MTQVIESIGINNFCKIIFLLSKIDNYKIHNQPNIRIIRRKKYQIETNYIAQLIINRVLNDEMRKKKNKREKPIKINCDG